MPEFPRKNVAGIPVPVKMVNLQVSSQSGQRMPAVQSQRVALRARGDRKLVAAVGCAVPGPPARPAHLPRRKFLVLPCALPRLAIVVVAVRAKSRSPAIPDQQPARPWETRQLCQFSDPLPLAHT